MCQVVADLQDSSGDVFALGDDDSGRVLGLDHASSLGRAPVLLALAKVLLGAKPVPAAEALYKESGWWVRRSGEFVVVMEFGGVGMRGLGAHAHNDDLSFCVEWRGRPVIVDPGTFLYTSDTAARNRLRSTAYHNTVMLDGGEQRTLGSDPFALVGSREALPCKRLGDAAIAVTAPLGCGVTHRREVLCQEQGVSLRDAFTGRARHTLEWRFNLHPTIGHTIVSGGVVLSVPGAGRLLLRSETPFARQEILPAEYSAGYGRREPSCAWLAGGEFQLPQSVTFEIRPAQD